MAVIGVDGIVLDKVPACLEAPAHKAAAIAALNQGHAVARAYGGLLAYAQDKVPARLGKISVPEQLVKVVLQHANGKMSRTAQQKHQLILMALQQHTQLLEL